MHEESSWIEGIMGTFYPNGDYEAGDGEFMNSLKKFCC
jgi:hypothetical protein